MTRSRNSRQGYRPMQKAHHDSPWMMEDRRRATQRQREDLRDEGLGGTAKRGRPR